MSITWEDYLWEGENHTTTAEIKNVEDQLNITFPLDYLTIVKKHQGQTPHPQILSLEGGFTTSCSVLFHFTKDEYENAYNVLSSYKNTRGHIPENVIPIADTPGGDHICFDFRSNENSPSIVFVAHELNGDDAIIPITDNFTKFLEMLYEDEEE